ncbi:MAG: hypothetical protein ACTMHH_06895 [Nesterenkonia sp.]
MSEKSNRVLAGLLLGFALAASALILSIPALFDAPKPSQIWLTAVFGGLTAGLGAALVLMRRSQRPSAE